VQRAFGFQPVTQSHLIGPGQKSHSFAGKKVKSKKKKQAHKQLAIALCSPAPIKDHWQQAAGNRTRGPGCEGRRIIVCINN